MVKVVARIRIRPLASSDPQDGDPIEILAVTYRDGTHVERLTLSETERYMNKLSEERARLLHEYDRGHYDEVG